ncbi:C-terminal helicase domain-containing protein [Pedobacter sp. NJ-S-72]
MILLDLKKAWLKTPIKLRNTAVEDFQQNENTRVLLISLKAGGTGLNLTAADYVYLIDPWWNPAAEAHKQLIVAIELVRINP